jgi:hypothetical protein
MFSTQAVSFRNLTRPIVRDAGTAVFARPACSSTAANWYAPNWYGAPGLV